MDLSPNAKASFQDGTEGHVVRVIYDPRTKDVTHVVVRVGHLSEPRLVPVSDVEHSDESGAHLTIGEREFESCEPFTDVEFVSYDEALEGRVFDSFVPLDDSFILGWPYVRPGEPMPVDVERVPPGEVAFGRGAAVDASDGHIGHVAAFVTDWGSGHLTHIVLGHGHLWGRRRISVPLSAVGRVEDDRVVLTLTKKEVEALPDIPHA